MGTRADFYVGRDAGAEWIGSIAWDGYRDGIDAAVLTATDEASYREAVKAFFASRDDVTLPEQGWPWPWDDSSITDCSYWFFDRAVWDERRGTYQPCAEPAPETDDSYNASVEGAPRIVFPDMKSRRAVTFGPRSGLIVIGAA